MHWFLHGWSILHLKVFGMHFSLKRLKKSFFRLKLKLLCFATPVLSFYRVSIIVSFISCIFIMFHILSVLPSFSEREWSIQSFHSCPSILGTCNPSFIKDIPILTVINMYTELYFSHNNIQLASKNIRSINLWCLSTSILSTRHNH